jgi:hypothetical protein
MKRRSTEDAQIMRDQAPHAALDAAARTPKEVVQRWRDLRGMLIRQLDMFETGGLTLRSNNVNISAAAIRDLKRDILEFDALILDSV